jgi:hypothetical protein
MPLPSRAASPLPSGSLPSYRHEVFAPITSTELDRSPNGSLSNHAAISSIEGMGIFDSSFDQESYQYDFDFAQELWEQAGQTNGNDSLPLYVLDKREELEKLID